MRGHIFRFQLMEPGTLKMPHSSLHLKLILTEQKIGLKYLEMTNIEF